MRLRSVLRFVCVFAAVTALVGGVALVVVRPSPSEPWSTWALIFLGAFPAWLAAEFVSERIFFRNPLASAIDRRTSGRQLSLLRMAYLLAVCLLVAGVIAGLVALRAT